MLDVAMSKKLASNQDEIFKLDLEVQQSIWEDAAYRVKEMKVTSGKILLDLHGVDLSEIGYIISLPIEIITPDLIIIIESSYENIIKRIAKLHLTFEHTHPFCDGNGRIGRVINNYLLMREGYVPINIKFIDRKKYYEAFREFDAKGTTAIMEEIVGKALTNSYYKRLAYLEGKKIITLAEYGKNNKLSHSNLINKAGRQTIEAFLEKNVWKIGMDNRK